MGEYCNLYFLAYPYYPISLLFAFSSQNCSPQKTEMTISGKDKANSIIMETIGPNQKVWHEKPISKAHGIIDTDLARDNLENDIPFADLQDL